MRVIVYIVSEWPCVALCGMKTGDQRQSTAQFTLLALNGIAPRRNGMQFSRPKYFLSAQPEQGFAQGFAIRFGEFPCAVHPAGPRLCPRTFARIFEIASLQEPH